MNKLQKFLKCLLNLNRNNFYLIIIIAFYAITELSIIEWGIPGLTHPFPYHMDEMHQLEFVRNVFKYGTSDTSGVTQIPITQFILTGIFLIPFYLTKYINPGIITSAISALSEQHKLFVVLRLNTLLFGIGTVMVLAITGSKFFKLNKTLIVFLFVITPIWLSLSNYFKYDIALAFWITLSIFTLLRLDKNAKIKDYLLTGVVVGFTVGTKVSAAPLILLLSITGPILSKKIYLKKIIGGYLAFLLTFILIGVPDVIFRFHNYVFFITRITTQLSRTRESFNLPTNFLEYIFIHQLPTSFGFLFFILFIFSVIYLIFKNLYFVTEKKQVDRKEIMLLIGLILFILILAPLKLELGGNRILMLLPFLVLITGKTLKDAWTSLRNYKYIVIIFVLLVCSIQFIQSFSWIYMRYKQSPQQNASNWIKANIKMGTTIGIEDIPVYQLLPDLVLKEYYNDFYKIRTNNYYKYKIISSQSKILPPVIIVTNDAIYERYIKRGPKKDLLRRLNANGYQKRYTASPDVKLFNYFGTDLDFYISGLLAVPVTISIYESYR